MRKVVAFQAEDGSLHATEQAAKRIDDSFLVKPLLCKLDKAFARAEEAKLDKAFGLLAFIRENWDAISVFKPDDNKV